MCERRDRDRDEGRIRLTDDMFAVCKPLFREDLELSMRIQARNCFAK